MAGTATSTRAGRLADRLGPRPVLLGAAGVAALGATAMLTTWLGVVIAGLALLTVGFFMYATSSRSLVPSRLQSLAEIAYEFIANMLRDSIGKEGMKYFPFVFALFIFILIIGDQPMDEDQDEEGEGESPRRQRLMGNA